MFKELLLKSLKTLTPEEKNDVRKILEGEKFDNNEVVDEKIGEDTENNIEKGENNMSVKDDDKTKVETSINIDEKDKSNEIDDNSTKEKVEDTEKVDEKVENTAKEVENTAKEVENTDEKTDNVEDTEETATVQTVEPAGNGARLEDLVTKDELSERLAAIEAKMEAVVKENMDLKNKYENKDFGNLQRQGVMERNKLANSSFDEYSKQFM